MTKDQRVPYSPTMYAGQNHETAVLNRCGGILKRFKNGPFVLLNLLKAAQSYGHLMPKPYTKADIARAKKRKNRRKMAKASRRVTRKAGRG